MRDIAEFRITKPTPASEVIDRACELMLDEPKRVRMGDWGSKLDPGARLVNYDADGTEIDMTPACGYTACGAGWLGFVVGRAVEDSDASISKALTGIPNNSRELSDAEWAKLTRKQRASSALRRFFLHTDLTNAPNQGTITHAQEAVAALRAIKEEYRDVFDSVVVQPEKELGGH